MDNIISNKIYRIKDEKIADFNYKLIKNILLNNYFIGELSNNYFIGELETNPAFVGKTCLKDVGKSVPLVIFECINVQPLWKSGRALVFTSF